MALRKGFLVVQAGEPISKTLEPAVRYRGFVLIPQPDLSWLVRPERSPMHVLPFRAPACSISDVKALVDWRLARLGGIGGRGSIYYLNKPIHGALAPANCA